MISVNGRYFSAKKEPGLQERGLRLGDEILLNPVSGRRKVIKLQRTHIHFSSQNPITELQQGHAVILPTLADEKISFSLLLCGDEESKGRYLLRSNQDCPFRINGNYSFESFVERGDRIQLGSNFLEMRRTLEQDFHELLTHPILQNEKLIRSNLNILIAGETGSGKTHLAKLIHKHSGRRGNFVHVNLSAFSSNLIESELFGHVKGAFTGANQDRRGAFLEAREGTLFLDEVDSLPLDIQTKLLLFLDDKTIRPVGGQKEIQCPTRLIFAGANPLQQLVERKLMRDDFYYRLSSGHKVELTSLRDDPEKVKRFVYQFSLQEDVSFHPKLIEFYKTLPWPGNIRQLMGHLDKKKTLSVSRKIDFDDLDKELIVQSSSLLQIAGEKKIVPLDEFKHHYVQTVYQQMNQDQKKTSLALEISAKRLKRILLRFPKGK